MVSFKRHLDREEEEEENSAVGITQKHVGKQEWQRHLAAGFTGVINIYFTHRAN